ncbi:agenet domain-containing protein [Actinidia rufa]|uniref:Agenet domain-containing protein n=1 Tax=Actinidia rufa TaxID=165716 RepID=A0A7J0HET7_9ERIC|nr:agenet domain-containing protein [Actinidia rufa]
MLTAHFQKGDKVEVRRGDDSSRWFSVTVLRSSPTKHKGMIYVEYETITAGLKRRREYVAVASVRPSPPAEFLRSFKIGEKVDALHESAWRVGSVVDVLENSRYSVSFDGVVEESAFEQWNLRVHRDWDDGSWIPPFDSQMKPRALKLRIKFSGRTSDASFSKGTVVEVRSGREGYQGSWYAAVIVDSIGTDKFLVEYQTLRAGDETELKENDVDAWCNDGWWEGLIFEVLDDHKYLVYLMGTNGEMTAEHSELRPHQEWIGGKWVAASMRTSGLKLKSRERERKFKVKDGGRISEAKFSEGTVVEVKSNEEGYQGSWFTAVIVGSIPKDKFLVQYQTLKTDDETELLKERVDASCIRPCPSVIQRVDRFKLFEKVDAWYNDGWWVVLSPEFLVA